MSSMRARKIVNTKSTCNEYVVCEARQCGFVEVNFRKLTAMYHSFSSILEGQVEIPDLQLAIRIRPSLSDKNTQDVLIVESRLVKQWFRRCVRDYREQCPIFESRICSGGVNPSF